MYKRKIIIMYMCGKKMKGKCNDGRKRNGGRRKRKQSQRRKRAKKVRSNKSFPKCLRSFCYISLNLLSLRCYITSLSLHGIEAFRN